jgi:hypothetical protein
MMEIPAELSCGLCPFHSDDCMCIYEGEDFRGDGVLVYDRLPACLSAYPKGAVITITAKEVK